MYLGYVSVTITVLTKLSYNLNWR